MRFKKASRQQSRIKMAIQGPSGSGKTFSSLMIAKGLVGDWDKVCVIDTENGSSHLYAHLGPYNVITKHSHIPEQYIQAIRFCDKNGIECIILDSIPHCWEELLDQHANMTGNSFTNWAAITPRHKALIHAILSSKAHVIATMRTKQDYVLQLRNGKHVPEKVGLKAVQRDGVDYEFTLVFDMDISHHVSVSKDRTGLFMGNPEYTSFIPDVTTGELLSQWTMENVEPIIQQVEQCTTLDELKKLYARIEPEDPEIKKLFTKRKFDFTIESNGVGSQIHSS